MSTPSFSIIIPTYNRLNQLKDCLGSLQALDFPKTQFEVIIIDDGGAEPLDLIVEYFHQFFKVSLIRQQNKGPAFARNAGATKAKGQYLAFLDDDCLADKNWLTVLTKQFEISPNRMLGGKTINRLTKNIFAATSQLIIDFVYQFYNATPNKAQFFAANNMAMPTHLFHQLKGFDENFRTSEDRDLCARWLQAGLEMTYVADALIYHAHPLTFWQFCQQHFNYGKGAYYYHQKNGNTPNTTTQSVVKMHTKLSNWLFFPFKEYPFLKALHFSFLLIIWQVVNLMGFLSAGLNKHKVNG